MYTVRTKITLAPEHKNQDFVMFIMRNEEYNPLTKIESEKLIQILNCYSNLFKKNEIILWDEEDVRLINPEDKDENLTFDFENVEDQISEIHWNTLTQIGHITGFDHKYVSSKL